MTFDFGWTNPSMPDVDMLEHIFEKHKELQLAIPPKGEWPGQESFSKEKRIQLLKEWKLAIESELQEMLDETGWKPWATSRHINEEAAKVEVIDAFFFWLNAAMTMRMSAVDVFEGYGEKWAKNMERHKDGTYDGVTGKCPGCKRGLDDAGVRCSSEITAPDGEYTPFWCQEKGFIAADGEKWIEGDGK
jgi:hypothetical protein